MGDGTGLSRVTFLMIGCQRCGTTWVDEALREHPEVYLPPQKQSYFFNRHYDRGIGWYAEQFAGVGPQHRAVGEVASNYCQVEVVPRVAEHVPDIKLIMAMRHPVDRAYSYFLSRHTQGNGRWASFEEALERDPDILARGRYIDEIEAVLEHYDGERLLLLFYDDLVADERGYLRSILGFIGVDSEFNSTQIGQRRHSAKVASIRYPLERAGLKPVLKTLKNSGVGRGVRRWLKRRARSEPGYQKSMPRATRSRLLEYYRPFNERLSAFTGRDLEAWNR